MFTAIFIFNHFLFIVEFYRFLLYICTIFVTRANWR